MEHKSNSYKVNRQQGEKVLRFSIRKYSFGAASVAVAALMFLGARVASADSLVENTSHSTAGVVNPENKVEPPVDVTEPTENRVEVAQNPSEKEMATDIGNVVKVVDKAKLRKVVEELNTTLSSKSDLDNSVISPIKDRVQKGQVLLDSDTAVQKDVDELLSLLESDLTALSNTAKESSKVQENVTENNTEIKDNKTTSELSEDDKTISDKKESLKLSAEQLQAAVLELPEHESTKEVLGKANEVLSLAQGLLTNTRVTSNELEDLNNRVKRTFNSVKIATLRLTSGKNDPRNGQSMGQGTQFRAYTPVSSGALKNVKYFASVDRNTNGGSYLRNDDPEFTEKKTVIKAKYEQSSSGKWMVYDVYFNNNGVAMADLSYSQHYYFQPPFNIMDGSNKVENLTFTRYQNVSRDPSKKLSDGGREFQKVGETAVISEPWRQRTNVFPGDRRSTYDPQGVSRANQKWQVFKRNQDDPYLDKIVRRTDGSYTDRVSYTLGIEVGRENLDYAIHMTARVKLKDNVTETEAANGNVYAASVTTGPTTNQSYIVGSQGTSLKTKPDAQLYPLKGSSHNKTVGDPLPNSDNPVTAKYITPKNGGEFPSGMDWGWKNNIKPSTDTAGIFTYIATARYQDGSTSNDADGAVKFTVKPKKPAITTDVANKKGLTNQTITVNVGTGVKTGSTVDLYSGNKVIGTGKTNGATATITVAEALPGTPITAITTVDNNGVVTSERSEGVTATDAPDNQAPTVKMTNPTDGNKEVVLSNNESSSPVTRIYRGATLNVPLKMYDNDPKGKVNLKYESGLPKGVTFNNGRTLSITGATEAHPQTTNIRGKVAADARLGKQTVTFKVSDDQGNNVDRGNNATVKFRTEVVDLEFEDGKGEVRQDGTLVVKGNKGTSLNDANTYLRTTDGTTHNDSFFPNGMKFRFIQPDKTVKNNVTFNTPGKHIVKAAAYFPENYAGTNGVQTVPRTGVTGDNVSEITNRAYLTKNIEVQIKPTAPTVTPENNGDVTVTPVSEENVNTLNFTYKHPNDSNITVTATKTGNKWAITSGAPNDGVTINPDTGVVTIKDRAIKDATEVTAKSVTTDRVESEPTTKDSKAGDKEPPKFEFTPNGVETKVENNEQVVYVTPTEETNLTIGRVTDNSGKLLETRIMEKNGNLNSGLGFQGLSYDELIRKDNTEVDAPRNINVTGKVHGYKTGTTPWTDTDEYTRYVIAKDASTNELRDTSDGINPTRIKFKILTQATKYDPQITTQAINKDVTASDAKVTQAEFDAIKSNITFSSQRGEVKISNSPNNRTAGLNITMNDNGAIKKNPTDGSYYVSATITYPDLSTENIEIPVSKSDTTAPRVTINGKELSETATDYSFIVFKGSTFNPTLRVSDDKNNVKSVSVSGLPSGNNFSATGDWSKNGADIQVTGDTITATNNATPGDHEASVVVKDALNNEKTYKFKYKVVDVAIRETPKTVPLNTQLEDSHNYVKVVDAPNADGNDKYYPAGMSFKWKKGTEEVANETRLSRPGIVSEYKPEVKFKSGAGYYTTTIDGNQVKVYTPATIERDQTFHVKPTAPTITPLEKGDVTVTPVSEENVNRLNFTYKHPNGQTTITVTATKTGNRWSLTSGAPADGVTIDPETGVVTIKDRAIKDATEITAKSVTTDSVDSDTTTANSKAGDKEPPVFTFTQDGKEKVVDNNGRQVVYVTPTEETNLTIGNVTDNSGKLVEAIFRETSGNTSNGLGFPGLNYNA